MSESARHLFSRLFSESREALRRYVRRYVRSDEAAEEVVQEAFLRTYEKRDAVQTPRAFLFSTAHNLAADLRRRDRTVPRESVEDEVALVEVETSLDDALIADEFSGILKQAIELLPPQQQAALTLRVFHGRSYKEIGEILGISWRTVEKHVVKGTSCVQKYVLGRYCPGQNGPGRDDGGHHG